MKLYIIWYIISSENNHNLLVITGNSPKEMSLKEKNCVQFTTEWITWSLILACVCTRCVKIAIWLYTALGQKCIIGHAASWQVPFHFDTMYVWALEKIMLVQLSSSVYISLVPLMSASSKVKVNVIVNGHAICNSALWWQNNTQKSYNVTHINAWTSLGYNTGTKVTIVNYTMQYVYQYTIDLSNCTNYDIKLSISTMNKNQFEDTV